MEIQVRRSTRRKKTVQARLVGGVLEVAIPAHLSPDEEARWVEIMRERFDRKRSAAHIGLEARARRLARKYGLPDPVSIVWSERQHTLWGSCTVESGRIRVSSLLAEYPGWVLDYVIVHELAHLVEPRHSDAFWRLVNGYPLAERARGYLLGRGDMGS